MEQVFEKLGLIPPSNDLPVPTTPDAQSHGCEAMPAFQMQDTVHSTWDGINESELGDTLSYHDEHMALTPVSPASIGENHSFLKLAFQRYTECGGNDSGNVCSDPRSCHQDYIRAALGDKFIEEKNSLMPNQDPYYDEELYLLDGSTTRCTLYPLPTLTEIMVLFLEYLRDFNSICPLLSLCLYSRYVMGNMAVLLSYQTAGLVSMWFSLWHT
jgi:hypothetical protein